MLWTKQKRAACRQREASLEDYLQGQLPEGRARDLEVHLISCSSCEGALETARASRRILEAARQPVGEPSPAFSRRVMATIRTEEARRRALGEFWRPLESLAWRLTWSATLALALLVGYVLGLGPSRRQPIRSAQPTQVREIFQEFNAPPADREEALLVLVEKSNHDGR